MPSAAESAHTGGSSRAASTASSQSSGSLAPWALKNLMPLSAKGLWLALMTTPSCARCARVRYATAGVGTGPKSTTLTPAELNPASSAAG